MFKILQTKYFDNIQKILDINNILLLFFKIVQT